MSWDDDIELNDAVGTPDTFKKTYRAAAERAGKELRVDPNVILGQWGLETDWGKKVIPGTNNLGNIKSPKGVSARDNQLGTTSRYAKYDSPDDFADAYVKLIKSRYPKAVGAGDDAQKFTDGLKGYAQDTRYAGKVQAASNAVSNANWADDITLNPIANDTQQQAAPVAAPVQPQNPAPTSSQVLKSEGESFLQGLKDPISGGAQLLTHLLPDSVVQAGNRLNNALAQYGIVAPLPAGGLDQQIKQEESALQANRAAAGRTGVDWARLGGNVASPVNWLVAAGTPAAAGATLGARVASGIGQGAVSGALSPVTDGNFAAEKAKQIGFAALTGGAVPTVAEGAARVIRPNVSPEVNALKQAGVSMTPGQVLGGTAKALEEKSESVPFLGDVIRGAKRANLESFNRATINDSLSSIGESLPKAQEVGHDAIDYAAGKIGDKYDDVLSKMNGVMDRPLRNSLSTLRRMSYGLPREEGAKFRNILQREVSGRFTDQGKADGQSVKEIEESLGKLGAKYARSDDPAQRNMANGIKEAHKQFQSMLKRQNPTQADELKKVNQAYAKFLRVQTAAGRVGAEDGIFSPAQLKSAVRELDPSKRKSAYARGNAMSQGIAKAGQKVLGNKVPNSGTTDRLMATQLATAIPGLAASIPALALYSGPGQKLAEAALTSRPQSANALAQLARSGTPYLNALTLPLLGALKP